MADDTGAPTEREKMCRGEPYDPSEERLVAERERARSLTRAYNETGPTEREERRRLLEELLGAVGEGVTVLPPFRCDYGWNVRVGDEWFANYDCVILDTCPVEIGDGCLFGPGVHVYTATHPLGADERAAGLESGAPVTVGDDVWVGGRAVVNPGVTVGDRAVVGSGSVVTDDVPAGTLVAGNPARRIRDLEDADGP